MSSLSLVLNGLDCPNCANKIENKVARLGHVKEANLNFANQEICILYEAIAKEELISEVSGIVQALEPHVEVWEKGVRKEKAGNHQAHCGENCCDGSHEGPHGVTGGDRASNQSGLNLAKQQWLDRQAVVKLSRLVCGMALYLAAIFGGFSPTISLTLFVGAYLVFGLDILYIAIRNIFRGEVFDENFLMSLATIGAFVLGEYPEAVAVMLFYQVGEFFQGLAVGKSRRSIKGLMDIKAEFANLELESGDLVQIDPAEVAVGQVVVVKPGEKVPLDGIVVAGSSQIDTSSLTGESVPRLVSPGDEVQNGTINKTGLFKLKVNKEYKDSTVAKVLELVENAGSRKAETEKFITRFARVYTPAVVIGAALLAIVPPLLLPGATFGDWVYRALVFLVISCPCALVVSIPLGFFSGIGAASGKGILVKGGNYLQALTKINTAVFDKTGTLTRGEFSVAQVLPAGPGLEEKLLQMAYAAEKNSNHPIARSIVEYFQSRNLPTVAEVVRNYQESPGLGITGNYGGDILLAGNGKLMAQYQIPYDNYQGMGTVVHVALGSLYLGYLVIADEIKGDAKEAMAQLRQKGVEKLVMLTGDRQENARLVADELGIDTVYAELMPYEKVEKLEEIYKNTKARVLFAGDGMNDAPVLARADVGVAMGGVGSDAAIEAADVVLMTDEPSKIPEAIGIAQNTYRIVQQNIVFALGVKAVVLAMGAFGYATMWLAIFADVGVTLLVVLNAMRRKS